MTAPTYLELVDQINNANSLTLKILSVAKRREKRIVQLEQQLRQEQERETYPEGLLHLLSSVADLTRDISQPWVDPELNYSQNPVYVSRNYAVPERLQAAHILDCIHANYPVVTLNPMIPTWDTPTN